MYRFNSKNPILLALLLAFSLSALAQNVETTTTSIKSKDNKNFRNFSIGINAGALYPAVATGGSNDYTNPKFSIGYGANIKYQIWHWFALQGDFLRGTVKGNNDKAFFGNSFPSAKSFETDLHYSGSLNGVFSTSVKNKIVPYISAGAGIASYDVKINNNSNGAPNRDYIANSPIREYFIQLAAGIKFALSQAINLDLGYRMHYIDGDNFNGVAYYSIAPNSLSGINPGRQLHTDKFSYGFLGLEFSLGNKAKKQLMFYNPLDELTNKVYSLENRVDSLNSRLNDIDRDTDGDGILDKMDKEPNTPAGCPVDSHGVSLDSDGDGVPDCRDKEKVTPTFCQPVDADGVGKCPPPECCANIAKNNEAAACAVGDLPSLSFKGNSNALSADAKSMLATVASKIKVNANCNITINGYHTASKASQSLCNRRVNAIKNYLVETEGISTNRINTNCEVGNGDANIVDIRSN